MNHLSAFDVLHGLGLCHILSWKSMLQMLSWSSSFLERMPPLPPCALVPLPTARNVASASLFATPLLPLPPFPLFPSLDNLGGDGVLGTIINVLGGALRGIELVLWRVTRDFPTGTADVDVQWDGKGGGGGS